MKSNETKNKSTRKQVRSLFRNNKFLLLLSFVISLVTWIVMSFGSDIGTERIITDIPINVSLSEEATDAGLQIFSGVGEKCSVTISGNRATIGTVTNQDINVTAQTANTINTVGNFSLSLSPSKTNISDDFTITSQPSPSVINVYVDYLMTKNFTIEDQVAYEVKENYYGVSTLSTKTLTITGPQTYVSKIEKAVVSGTINGSLTADYKINLPIKLYDSMGDEVPDNLLTLSVQNVDVDVSVLPEKTVSVIPAYKNKPSGLMMNSDYISIDPSEILVAGEEDIIQDLNNVTLDAIDFSNLSNVVQGLSVNIIMPDKCRNLTNQGVAEVRIDFSSMSKKTFTVDNISVKGLSDEYTSKITTHSLKVTVIGPESQIKNLTENNISAVIDASGTKIVTGSTSMPVAISINSANSCWAYGNYEANVTITKK